MALPDTPPDDIFLPGGRLRPDLLAGPTAAALDAAQRCAHETRWESLRSPHIFMGLLAKPDFAVRTGPVGLAPIHRGCCCNSASFSNRKTATKLVRPACTVNSSPTT